MTYTRINLVIAAVFATLLAATIVAVLAGGSSGTTSDRQRSDVGVHAPWQKERPVYASVTYHPHQLCEEFRHPAIVKPNPKS